MTVMQILEQLSQGMVVTFQIFFSTLFFSLVLGLGIALCRMTKNPVISFVAKVYISIMRGTPLMLQLLVVYFGPYFLFGVPISSSYRLTAVLIGFALNYAAYFNYIVFRHDFTPIMLYCCNQLLPVHFLLHCQTPSARPPAFPLSRPACRAWTEDA